MKTDWERGRKAWGRAWDLAKRQTQSQIRHSVWYGTEKQISEQVDGQICEPVWRLVYDQIMRRKYDRI